MIVCKVLGFAIIMSCIYWRRKNISIGCYQKTVNKYILMMIMKYVIRLSCGKTDLETLFVILKHEMFCPQLLYCISEIFAYIVSLCIL